MGKERHMHCEFPPCYSSCSAFRWARKTIGLACEVVDGLAFTGAGVVLRCGCQLHWEALESDS